MHSSNRYPVERMPQRSGEPHLKLRAIISECCARNSRNTARHHLGIPRAIKSEHRARSPRNPHHALTQAIYTFRQGRIIDRSHEALQYRASGLNLVIAAIVYWNTTYMADAVEHLRHAGEQVPPELLVHTSPIGWEHIAFSGDFLWERAAAATGRKPLTLPSQVYAA